MSLIHRYSKKSRARPWVIALLFLLSGCQKSNWNSSAIHGANKTSYSKRIASKAVGNPYIEFEVLKTHEGNLGYILLHIDRIISSSGRPDQVLATLTSSSSFERAFTASPLRGGQRILLPGEMTSLILSELSSGQTIQITLADIGLEIAPEGFKEAYKKLNTPKPWFKLPNIAMDWSTN